MSPVQTVTYVTGMDLDEMARPTGETSNLLFETLQEWDTYLKHHTATYREPLP